MNKQQRGLLIIDDDPDNLKLFRLALRKHPLIGPVVTMLDGREALQYLCECREKHNPAKVLPSLIITDLKMPGMNGLEVIQQIREEDILCRLPVIVFTASQEEEDISRSYRVGASSFIRKQIDYDTFCNQLEHILEYWLEINQPPY